VCVIVVKEGENINISTKKNLIIGFVIGLWLFLFMFLIKPFKQDRLDSLEVFYISISMSLVIMFCYILVVFIQNYIYKKYKKWNFKLEIFLMFIFLGLGFIGTFIIYKSEITKGSYSLLRFFIKDFLPAVLIIIPIAIFLRRIFFKQGDIKKEQNIIYIYGENKLDFLKLNKNDLISISSAQNYVEVSFLINNKLQTKLFRSSLKKIYLDLPFLQKVHRSHLINPYHFISFKDKKFLILTQKVIPFSEKYKNNITSY